jgi:hypothetical protein
MVDNVRLMKAKEKQKDFNMKLRKSLNKIEKKLDNGSGSSKSGSHRSLDWKIKSRSVSRHHQHSQRNSKRGYIAAQVHPLPRIIRGLGG